jgi:hypothetical protein
LIRPNGLTIADRDSIIALAAIAAAAELLRAADAILAAEPLDVELPLAPPQANALSGAIMKSMAGIASQPKKTSLAIKASSHRSILPCRPST